MKRSVCRLSCAGVGVYSCAQIQVQACMCVQVQVCACVYVCVKAVGVHRCVHVCRSNVWGRVDTCTEEPLLSAPAVLAGVLPVGSVVLPSVKLK